MPTEASTSASTPNPAPSVVTMLDTPRHHATLPSSGSTRKATLGSLARTSERMPDAVAREVRAALDQQHSSRRTGLVNVRHDRAE